MNSDVKNIFISVIVCFFLSSEVFAVMMGANALFEPNVAVNEGIVPSYNLEQEESSIAVDNTGNIYVVWADRRAEISYKIYFTRSTDGGNTFSPNKKVCDGVPGSQHHPSIAVDDIGNIYIVWSDNRFGTNYNIYFTNSTDGGNTFSPNKKVNVGDANGISSLDTSIAADGLGNVYIAWEDLRNGDYDIYFVNSADGGDTFPADQRINNDTGSASQKKPSIAVDDAGNVYIAWQDPRNGNPDIYFVNSTDGGHTFSNNMKVNDDGIGAKQWPPSIAADGAGNIYVTWTDFREDRPDIYFANSTDGGNTFSSNKKVNDGGALHYDPCIAADGAGIVYVTWEDARNGGDNIYFANSTDGGHTFSPNKQINDDNSGTEQYGPSIAAYGAGNIFIVWTDERGGNPDIFFTGSADGGHTFSPNKRLNDDVGSAWQNEPSIAVDGAGNIYIVWMDDRKGNYLDWDIYFASSTDGGKTFSTDKKINNDTGSTLQCDPSIAVDNAGNIYIAWADKREGNSDIYFADSTDGGSTFHGNKKVSDDAGNAVQDEPSIAVDNAGSIYIAWTDEREGNPDIYFTISTDGGSTFHGNKKVSDDAVSAVQNQPSTAVDNAGNIYIAWTDEREGDPDIYFAISTDNGSTFHGNKKVSDDAGNAVQDEPSIAVDNAGSIYIAWTDEREGDPDIYLTNSTDGGSTFSSNKKVNDDAGNAVQDEPSIAVDNAGSIYIAWTDKREGDPDIYFTNSTDGGYFFTTNEKVSDDAESAVQDQPSIAADNAGNAYIAWRDKRNDVSDIYFTVTAFRVFDIQVLNITDTTATITWESNRPADSIVDYSFSPAHLYRIEDSSKVTLHRMELTNLEPGRHYHFSVTSYNRSTVYTSSSDFTFTTKFPIYLEPGWNMISVPLNQTDSDPKKVLENISGQYDAVQCYDATDSADHWKHYNTAKPPYMNDLTDITRYIALWIHMKNATTLYVDGTAPEMWQVNKVPLVKGWNFVGYPSLIERAPPFGLPPEVDAVQWYNATSDRWESWGPGTYHGLDTLPLIGPGQGLWIHYTGVPTEWELEYVASNPVGEFAYTQDGSPCSVKFVRMYDNNETFITKVTSVGVLEATSAHSGNPILIRDDFGKYILTYVDTSYVIKLAYCNANPLKTTSWVTDIIICNGTGPNAFLINSTSLHIVHNARPIDSCSTCDQDVQIDRDGNDNIGDVTVGAETVLDGGNGVKGTLTHNKNIVAVWSMDTKSTIPSTSYVRSMRYIPGTGWRNMNGTSTVPDQITPDFQPSCAPFNYLAIAQHPANTHLYVLQQHDTNNFYRLIKAIWNETIGRWEWQPVIDNFITEEGGANGDHSRPAVFQDPFSGKLIVPSQSKYNGVWDADAGIWFSSLRVVTIDESDTKTRLGDDDLDNLPRGTARGQTIVIPDKSGYYYLIYPIGVKQGYQRNLNLIIWNGTSWSSSSKVIDSLGFYPSAAVGSLF